MFTKRWSYTWPKNWVSWGMWWDWDISEPWAPQPVGMVGSLLKLESAFTSFLLVLRTSKACGSFIFCVLWESFSLIYFETVDILVKQLSLLIQFMRQLIGETERWRWILVEAPTFHQEHYSWPWCWIFLFIW